MAAGESPEGWVSRQVVVEMYGGSVREVARLRGINDWGVVLAESSADGVERGVLYPWNCIDAVRLARREDFSGPPDAGPAGSP